MASNGVLHELKAVMIPPSGNIVEAVAGCPVFKTLVTAVKAAGLVGALSGQFKTLSFVPLFLSDSHQWSVQDIDVIVLLFLCSCLTRIASETDQVTVCNDINFLWLYSSQVTLSLIHI